MKTTLRQALVSIALVSALGATQAGATCGGGGGGGDGGMGSGGRIYNVPWLPAIAKETPKDGLFLYWLPSSLEETQTSSLRNSRVLALYACQCVSLFIEEIGSPESEKLGKGSHLPLVLMTSPDGEVLGKIEGRFGTVDVVAVEQMLQGEIQRRSEQLKAKLKSGQAKADAGEKEAAIAEFKAVYDQRCLFPKLARDAASELRKLGVNDLAVIPEGPDFNPAQSAKIEATMKEGLDAEQKNNFQSAEHLYLRAQKMDRADPAPLRYLGELFRHHIGDWGKARQEFDAILSMKADPLSRAVALHGLGKMTIHEGQFKKGESLMEQSIKTYPLALAYRNLAVYWNSEGDLVKADRYIKEALKSDRKDPFNLVFAAALEAKTGHAADALKIAQENEGLLPASYNLAAIYAQNGQKKKALELLKRHFYQYERNQNVRSKEMMEARVDSVFASMAHDPDFLALTSGADGKLPMRSDMK